MKRRYFIRGAGYLSLLALLQACKITDYLGGQKGPVARLSTSIPTSTSTSLPTFTPTLAASRTATATGQPDSPTATGTATPENTPTETATPETGVDGDTRRNGSCQHRRDLRKQLRLAVTDRDHRRREGRLQRRVLEEVVDDDLRDRLAEALGTRGRVLYSGRPVMAAPSGGAG